MNDDKPPPSPLDQLLDLFVYAPVGMIYEYEDVLPKLVRRGKSQVQLAKLIGQMAAKKGQDSLDGAVGGAVGGATGAVAKGITDFGSMVGLAPTEEERRFASSAGVVDAASADDGSEVAAVAEAADVSQAVAEPEATDAPVADSPLPIARYDELKAKEVIPLLDDLTPEQLERVARHEAANRNRKTVLAKVSRLADA